MRTSALAAAMLAVVVVSVSAQVPPIPTKFTNLQVLPKDIKQADLVEVMKQFSLGLGVRCERCHVGEGNDLSKFDFVADTKPAKKTARTMLKMVDILNSTHLKGVGDPAVATKVSCFTCHRGFIKPLTAPGGGLVTGR